MRYLTRNACCPDVNITYIDQLAITILYIHELLKPQTLISPSLSFVCFRVRADGPQNRNYTVNVGMVVVVCIPQYTMENHR